MNECFKTGNEMIPEGYTCTHTLIYECIKSTAKIGNFYKDLKSNASYDFTQRLY